MHRTNRVDEALFNTFSKMTGRISKITGRDSETLTWVFFWASAIAVIFLYEMTALIEKHTFGEFVYRGFLIALWTNILRERHREIKRVLAARKRLEEGGDVISFSLEEWAAFRAITILRLFYMFLLITSVFIDTYPPVGTLRDYIFDTGLFFLVWSMYAATDYYPGGKTVTERVKAGLQHILEKVGELAPQPQPVPIPIRG